MSAGGRGLWYKRLEVGPPPKLAASGARNFRGYQALLEDSPGKPQFAQSERPGPHDIRGYKTWVEVCVGSKPPTQHTLVGVSLEPHPPQIQIVCCP